jgi:hypothetical protein
MKQTEQTGRYNLTEEEQRESLRLNAAAINAARKAKKLGPRKRQ